MYSRRQELVPTCFNGNKLLGEIRQVSPQGFHPLAIKSHPVVKHRYSRSKQGTQVGKGSQAAGLSAGPAPSPFSHLYINYIPSQLV